MKLKPWMAKLFGAGLLAGLAAVLAGSAFLATPTVMDSARDILTPDQWQRLKRLLPAVTPREKRALLTLLQELPPPTLAALRDRLRLSHLFHTLPRPDLLQVLEAKGVAPWHDQIHILAGEPIAYDRLPFGLNSCNGPLRPAVRTHVAVHGIASPLTEWQEYLRQLQRQYPGDNILIYKYDYGGDAFLVSTSLRRGLLRAARDHRLSQFSILAHSLGGFVTYGALQAQSPFYPEPEADRQALHQLAIQFATVAAPLGSSWAIDLALNIKDMVKSPQAPYWLNASEILSHKGPYMQWVHTGSLLPNVTPHRVINIDDDLAAHFIFPQAVQDPPFPASLVLPETHKTRLRGVSHELAPVGYLYYQMFAQGQPSLPEALLQTPVPQLLAAEIDLALVWRMLRENNNPADERFIPLLAAHFLRYDQPLPPPSLALLDQTLRHLSRQDTKDLLNELGYRPSSATDSDRVRTLLARHLTADLIQALIPR